MSAPTSWMTAVATDADLSVLVDHVKRIRNMIRELNGDKPLEEGE